MNLAATYPQWIRAARRQDRIDAMRRRRHSCIRRGGAGHAVPRGPGNQRRNKDRCYLIIFTSFDFV